MAKGRKRYDWFGINSQSREQWDQLCPVGEYRIANKDALLGVLPARLLATYDSVFIMASGTLSGVVYYMANGNRIDSKDGAIDQMPFGLAFVGNAPIPSGCLIQHGDWGGRTTHPPAEFWGLVDASGTPSHYPLSELPLETTGKITDLKIASQADAFGNLVGVLKDQIESDE